MLRGALAQRVKYWLETGESLAFAPVRAARAVKVRATRHSIRHARGVFAPRLVKTSQRRWPGYFTRARNFGATVCPWIGCSRRSQ